MRNLATVLICVLGAFLLSAQDKYDPETIEENNIKEIRSYLFDQESSIDSSLITREYFNSKGRRTKIEIHDSLGIRMEYIYIYQDDTLRVERITKAKGVFKSKTKIQYDNKNRETKAVDYDIEGKKTGTYSKTKYNDRKRTEENKIYFSSKLAVHTKKKYDKNRKLIEYAINENGKWIQKLNDEGSLTNYKTTEVEDYQNLGLKLVKEVLVMEKDKSILGLQGRLNLVENDVLKTEKYVSENGLIKYEKQYLNNQLLAIKKYKYICYK